MTAEETKFEQLPEDVVAEILSRLPAKSLLQCKSLRKNWRTLIQTPNFVAKHHHHPTNPALSFVHHYSLDAMESGFSLFDEETQVLASHSYQDYTNTSVSVWEINGPLNGLFSLYNDQEQVTLWNPATREAKSLPVSYPEVSASFRMNSYKLGFGMDPSNGNYKVVWIRDYWDPIADAWHSPAIISVYTLTTDSWKHFEELHICSRILGKSCCNAYLDGFYYWRANNNGKIVSFDMGNEVFREIQTPETFKSTQGDLALYNDSVAMFLYESMNMQTSIDVWVMDRAMCWTKMASLGPFLNIKRPLGYGKNGEVLLEIVNSELHMYDPRSKEIRALGPRRKGYSLQASVFKESLVSIKNLVAQK
ncbi:PREDICTED: F-box protein CPR30-like [Ipomoea nil]|uniref:F-box protein CPR30-like n=1 Tax=Ipomoea nil TaxID=35883 RepID=UPI0009016148|nr:PREDICTED: F-box protein CPR30-like [Ipomoea nil]